MLDPVCNVMNDLQFFLMHLTVALFVFAAHAALVWIPTYFCSSCSSCLDSDMFLQLMQLLSGFRQWLVKTCGESSVYELTDQNKNFV